MDAPTWLSVVSPFYIAVGQVVEELTRRNIAEIDIDLLRLKREELTDRLQEVNAEVARAADLEKKNAIADLASRGLLGSSLKQSSQNGVDTRAANELEKMHREYNRAIERIALLERKINARNRRWWVGPFRWLFGGYIIRT